MTKVQNTIKMSHSQLNRKYIYCLLQYLTNISIFAIQVNMLNVNSCYWENRVHKYRFVAVFHVEQNVLYRHIYENIHHMGIWKIFHARQILLTFRMNNLSGLVIASDIEKVSERIVTWRSMKLHCFLLFSLLAEMFSEIRIICRFSWRFIAF